MTLIIWGVGIVAVLGTIATLWIIVQWILSDARDKERFRDPNRPSPPPQ